MRGMICMNIINELYQIVSDIRSGKIVEAYKVEELLNHYCENPIVEEEGFTTHPFTDPLSAETLNQSYHNEKGVDHPNYIAHQLKMIEGLLKDKDMLIESGAYKPEYFSQLEQIKERIEKEGFIKEDKLGNPVPADIETKIQETSQRYIASIGDNSKEDRLEESR